MTYPWFHLNSDFSTLLRLNAAYGGHFLPRLRGATPLIAF